MNILITGITGFVGSHMADYLLLNTDADIYAMRRWRSDDRNIKHLYGNSRVTFIESDLMDRGSIASIISEAEPDYVFHFAAQSYPMSSFITPIYTLNINVVGTTNLLEELRIARDRGICDPIIISVSSSEVYGNPRLDEIPIKETNPIRAANPYSISKVAHDLLSQMYHQAYGLKIIITRMFSHEGARRGRMFAISNFAYQIVQHEKEFRSKYTTMNNKKVTLVHWPPPVHSLKIKVGNLNSVRTYSHIDDAVRAYWICAIDGEVGNVYNIGGDYTCTVGDVLDNLLHKSVLPFESFFTEIDPGRIRLTDITLQIPDCAKFKHLTGWKPKKSLDDITTDLLNYWREML